ncbi:hypothetical protein FH972_022027 [Carpinus fangiana]|uniref:Uncharacterized protein n=1 Tax=Carpinus fangiana TaxID=176857 RepID=A0A5N6KT85_9ROSI|nr:hypothetical protein FH972_022027 [Carpinus fangiana]
MQCGNALGNATPSTLHLPYRQRRHASETGKQCKVCKCKTKARKYNQRKDTDSLTSSSLLPSPNGPLVLAPSTPLDPTTLLAAQRLLREHPAAVALRIALLLALRLEHPGVARHAVLALRQRVGARAHAHQLNLGDEEAVAARVLAHEAVQVRQLALVRDLGAARRLRAHARVPGRVGLDEADDAAAAVAHDGALEVVLVVGHKVGLLVGGRGLRLVAVGVDGQVRIAKSDFEGCVDLGGIVVDVAVVESGHTVGIGSDAAGLSKGRLGDRELEQAGNAGDCLHRLEAKVRPGAQVADIPPEVGVLQAAGEGGTAHERRGRVRGGARSSCTTSVQHHSGPAEASVAACSTRMITRYPPAACPRVVVTTAWGKEAGKVGQSSHARHAKDH